MSEDSDDIETNSDIDAEMNTSDDHEYLTENEFDIFSDQGKSK